MNKSLSYYYIPNNDIIQYKPINLDIPNTITIVASWMFVIIVTQLKTYNIK